MTATGFGLAVLTDAHAKAVTEIRSAVRLPR
jgi:hypothetical protein